MPGQVLNVKVCPLPILNDCQTNIDVIKIMADLWFLTIRNLNSYYTFRKSSELTWMKA